MLAPLKLSFSSLLFLLVWIPLSQATQIHPEKMVVPSSEPQGSHPLLVLPPSDIVDNSSLLKQEQVTAAFRSPNYTLLGYKVKKINSNRFCLNRKLINERVELRLRQNGIEPEKGEMGPEFPNLLIEISLNNSTFSIHADLLRLSASKLPQQPPPSKKIFWKKEISGLHDHDLDIILDSLDYLLAQFLEQYLLANHALRAK